MTYANDHPVRLVGGRLCLDLVNTADWSDLGEVVHEKIVGEDDLVVWLKALGLPEASPPDVAAFHALRADLRAFLRAEGRSGAARVHRELEAFEPGREIGRQPLAALAAMSALSVAADRRELARIKTCPGADCGWMFVDETKNSRRTWCLMETCGNRAKAARHYKRKTEQGSTR